MIRIFNKGLGLDHIFHQGFKKFRNEFFDLEKEFGKDMWAFNRNFFNQNVKKQHAHPNQAPKVEGQQATSQAQKQNTSNQVAETYNKNFAVEQTQKVGDFFEKRGFKVRKSEPNDNLHWVSGNKVFDNDKYFDKQYFSHAIDKENPWKNRFQGFARNYESKDGKYKEFFSYEKYEFNNPLNRNIKQNQHSQKLTQQQTQNAAKNETSKGATQNNAQNNYDQSVHASVYD